MSDIMFPEPEIQPIKGGWMAMTPRSFKYRFAVIGASKEDALDRFASESRCWEELDQRVQFAKVSASR